MGTSPTDGIGSDCVRWSLSAGCSSSSLFDEFSRFRFLELVGGDFGEDD